MKKALFLVLAVALAVGGCCNKNRLSSVGWEDWNPRQQGAEHEARDLPWIDVTVRTNPGQQFEVFGVPISTNGEQRWIHGDGATNLMTFPELPFWVRETLDVEGTRALREAYLRDLSEAILNMELQMQPGDEAARVRALRDVQEEISQQPVRVQQLQQVERAGEVYFRVNGRKIGVKLYTPDEGWLERIHIDAPEGRSGNEVTVVGYYSGSVKPMALAFPMKKCIWCGDVQVCSASAACP